MQSVFIVLSLLICVAYFSLFERKLLSLEQIRLGPNKVGPIGILQPLSDAPKLLSKTICPQSESWELFIMPFITFMLSVSWWYPLYFPKTLWESNNSLLILIFISSVSVYALIFTGSLPKSKYSALGSLRAITLSISFELVFSTAMLSMAVVFNSFSIKFMATNQSVPNIISMIVVGILVWTSLIAECGRTPFDLPESESELVSGFNVEYGGSRYVLLYLSESLLLTISSIIMSILFTCGYNPLVVLTWISISIVMRASAPRIRYDKCMMFGWEFSIPLILMFMSIYVLM
uniref:NADH-ubiquinone oxidoreductase chain 1 n=2 Tax=Pediculus humanus TaxID=121225 RepID=X2D1R0_PEDHC|nr:NADH dehydrogenase subunit 1 [Pediculus humanus corporis]AHF70572.1 NADH dehydrogenase subunit 1 [Pediculus humanus capitis]AHF70575.1 NADH dehydrogenase subunit 1 [Pediculus humanus corporis]AHF70576.1 NADH dehydrogenase subunit 1 [Pediculus humanus capitis]